MIKTEDRLRIAVLIEALSVASDESELHLKEGPAGWPFAERTSRTVGGAGVERSGTEFPRHPTPIPNIHKKKRSTHF